MLRERGGIQADDYYSRDEAESVFERAAQRVNDRQADIRENIFQSLHKLYNETSCDPEEGFPPLSAE